MSEKILEYKKTETITQYLRRANEFRAQLESEKYDVILNFLNEFLGLSDKFKLKSITDFKKIKHNDLIKDPSKNKKLVKKYLDDFKDKLNLEWTEKQINKMKDEYFIHIIRSILNKINYKLKKRTYDSGVYYYAKSNK